MAAPRAWNLWGIEFALANFDAGVNPIDIHRYLHANGYSLLDLATVEGWLRTNGRSVKKFPAQAMAANSPPTCRRYVELRPAPVNTRPSFSSGVEPSHLKNDRNVDIRCAPATNQHADHQPAGNGRTISPRTVRKRSQSPIAMPQDYRLKPWDAQADRFASTAHRKGDSVFSIRLNLEIQGYDVSEGGVESSLRAQGVTDSALVVDW